MDTCGRSCQLPAQAIIPEPQLASILASLGTGPTFDGSHVGPLPLPGHSGRRRHGRAGLFRYWWVPGNSQKGLPLVQRKVVRARPLLYWAGTAQSYIASFETLAQIALLHVLTAALPGGRMRVRIKSWSDNTGAESASNRLYTNKYPLNMLVRRLSFFSCYSGVFLDVSHIPGELTRMQACFPGGQASRRSYPTASRLVGEFCWTSNSCGFDARQ